MLLHLGTGACFRLNPTAASIADGLMAGETVEAIAKMLSARFEIPLTRARADVSATREALENAPLRAKNEELLSYDASGPAHRVLVGDKPVLCVHPSRAVIDLVDPAASPREVNDAVDGVVPKLLALRGLVTFHASAVVDHGGVRAFSGQSGAGKTTTAREFANAGCVLVSEDLLVVQVGNDAPHAVLEAEAKARAWARETQRAFELNSRAAIDFSVLDEVATGAALPLREIWFLDAGRREGRGIQLTGLDRPDSLMALLGNLFLASEAPNDWQAALASLRALNLDAFAATMPSGLDALHSAIRRPSVG